MSEMDLFVLCQFEDGVELIPRKWLVQSEGDEPLWALWPPFKSSKFRKAVQHQVNPEIDTWQLCRVQSILFTTNDYEYGRKKMRQSEVQSELDVTDIETDKTKRKILKAKRHSGSDESEDSDVVYPQFPKNLLRGESQLPSSSNDSLKAAFESLTNHLVPPDSYEEQEQENRHLIGGLSKKCSVQLEGSSKTVVFNESNEPNSQGLRVKRASPNNDDNAWSMKRAVSTEGISRTPGHSIQMRIVETLGNKPTSVQQASPQNNDNSAVIVSKLDDIRKAVHMNALVQREILEKLNLFQNLFEDRREPVGDHEMGDLLKLPVTTPEEMEELERLLESNQQAKNELVRRLKFLTRGGVSKSTQALLSHIVSNELAALYSFHGRTKLAFSDSPINGIIKDVLAERFPDSGYSPVKAAAKNWFRQANLRLSREKK